MKYIIDESTLGEIAEAIREKDGTFNPILVADFSQRILDIPSGGDVPLQFDYTEFEMPSTVNLNGGYTFYHTLEKVPDLVFLYSTNPDSPSGTYPLREALSWKIIDGSDFQLIQRTNAGDSPIAEFSMDDESVYIKSNYQCMLLAQHSYILVVGRIGD